VGGDIKRIGGEMNFTKKYIKECDCEEIQGLRKSLEWGDRYHHRAIKFDTPSIFLETENDRRKFLIWLPTGDQLDEEIDKLCKSKNWEYYVVLKKTTVLAMASGGRGKVYYPTFNKNPLIAKIKLLKQLLEEK
jgi:hypothetical protein